MNKELMWNEIMMICRALEKKEKYVPSVKNALKRKEEEKIYLKKKLLHYIEVLHKEGEIAETFESYEETVNSKVFFDWLTENAPKGFVVGKDDIHTSKYALKQRSIAEKEYKRHQHEIDDKYLTTYVKSCGEDLTKKDISTISKRFNVSSYVVEEKVKKVIKDLSR